MVLQNFAKNYQARNWHSFNTTSINQENDTAQVDSSLQDYDPLKCDFDLQQELNQLENLILDGVHVPLTGLTIIDEQQILEQLNLIKTNLPTALATAIEILAYKQQIIQEAVTYAHHVVESAQIQANQILNESAIIRKAELEATTIKIQAEQECQQLKSETQSKIEKWRELTIAECQEMQAGADDYADAVLGNLEKQLKDMLSVIHKGRQQLLDTPSIEEINAEVDC
jgi:cell division septum initiation protein DivIVA